jgi:hypothetical protein
MLIGVPKEIKTHEYRVGLTPGAVREYVACGHSVISKGMLVKGLARRTRIIGRLAQMWPTSLARYSPALTW